MEISVTMSYAVMAMSTIICFLLNALLDKLPIPPKYAEKSRRHRWRNVVVAAIHAVSGTIGGFASLYLNPELLEDHLHAFSSTMIISMAISNGYYVYDFVDIAKNMKLKECLPLMVHHIMGTGILSWVLIHRKTIGIMAISSCIEFNGIFLHLRHLLLMWDFKKEHIVFRINNAFNFVTYVVFRLGIFVYDSWWLCANRADVAWFLPPMAIILLILNTGLFYRLIAIGFVCWVLVEKRLIGLIALSSCMELNGIFLHLRHLLLMCDFKKEHIVFQINNAFNVVTYFVWRLGIFAYDTWWLCWNWADVGLFLPPMAGILLLLNIILFYRLIMSDYFRTAIQSSKQVDIMDG